MKSRTKFLAIGLSLVLLFPTIGFSPKVHGGEYIPSTQERIADRIREDRDNRVDKYMDYILESAKSVQYAMIKKDEIVLCGVKSVDGADVNSMYAIGSISKMFTTVAIMKLVDLELVSLDEPVTTYVPDFKMADERYKDITVRMLLNHSAGFLGQNLQNAFLYDDNDTLNHETLLSRLEVQKLQFSPGELTLYNNQGFSVAELIVERVSGLTYTEFLHRYLIEPLSMINTKTPQDNFDRNKLSQTYLPTYMGTSTDFPIETVNVIGTGGIYSTAKDLCYFGRIFLNNKTLSKRAVAQTLIPEYRKGIHHGPEKGRLDAGLGWDNVKLYPFDEQGIQVVNKNGDTFSSHASLVVAPEHDIAIAILSSGGSSTVNQMVAEQILADELILSGKMLRPQLIVPKKPIKMEIPEPLFRYEGLYADLMGTYEIKLNPNGTLNVYLPNMPKFPIQTFIHNGDGVFSDYAGTSRLKFVEEKNGHIYIKASAVINTGFLQDTVTMYQMQKIEPVRIPAEIAYAWQQRFGKKYYLVSEKYSSMMYPQHLQVLTLPNSMPIEGYFCNMRILNENDLVTPVALPSSNGSDGQYIKFYIENGVEYAKSSIGIYMDASGIKPLREGIYTMSEAAQYVTVAHDILLAVDIEGEGMFAVYNKQNQCVYSSIIEDATDVEISAGSTIIFAGEDETIFHTNILR
ncbi:MAG: hypothetical protein BEN18_10535 [Epulopiscium sp. Nuni2H_MBin001]|nr:MAG: hypothetical protein BEN18_10535 [Epulopiscium sp. Nuni2H_MBin001]